MGKKNGISAKSHQPDRDNSLVLPLLVAFRIFNALFVQTYFDPDEYWQSVEVSHYLAYGYGHLTWEWRPENSIRSILHPLVYAGVYRTLDAICSILGVTSDDWIILGPRVFQGILAAVGEWSIFRLTGKMFDQRTAYWTLFNMVTSWFWFYAGVRTYSNSMEAVLTWIGLYYWPWSNSPARPTSITKALILAALACVIRPPGIIFWSFLGWDLLRRSTSKSQLVLQAATIGGCILGLNTILDYWFYKKWTCTFYNFLRLNVVEGVSSYYGTHPWHWYATQGIPVVMGTHLLAVIYTVLHPTVRSHRNSLASAAGYTILIYSLLPHKEFRFLLPLLGPAMMLGGHGLSTWYDSPTRVKKWVKMVIVVLVIVIPNVLAAIYFAAMHKGGPIQVIDYLRKNKENVQDVVFLMPCHSTPFYSSLHTPIPMRFLTCEPPLRVERKQYYRDENTLFYQSTENFIVSFFHRQIGNTTAPWKVMYPHRDEVPAPKQSYSIKRYKWPSHLVMFECVESEMVKALRGSDYVRCARFFNGYFTDDPRQRGDVIVWCRPADAS
ncbi:hypothetical protein SeLEV6574_g07696 [Synchytrium endobioticum]|uniref:Mannosyltransferase n=1 Tax=Synchytrium endobioticum TaxID=286115 RepID=A0A507CK68_9FUNG|nr:hypothetical protein SeLEV6574_g07696 [Synchytrium endobioticum]